MTEPAELTIKIPGKKLAVRAWGPKDGPLVLALHGWLDNAASFDGLAPLLPNVRLMALDLPGHGLSTHHGAGDMYSFIDLVGDVFWAVEAMSWTRFAVLGHSMGAAIGTLLAGAFPERVAKLALLDGLGPLAEAAEDAPIRLARALKEQRRKAGRKVAEYPSAELLIQRLADGPSKLTEHASRTLLDRGLMETETGGVRWRADRRHRFPSRIRLTEEQVLAFLARIECSTLVVRPTEGLPFGKELVDKRLSVLRKVEVVEVPGRHHVHLDYPDRVAPILQRFFASLVRE